MSRKQLKFTERPIERSLADYQRSLSQIDTEIRDLSRRRQLLISQCRTQFTLCGECMKQGILVPCYQGSTCSDCNEEMRESP